MENTVGLTDFSILQSNRKFRKRVILAYKRPKGQKRERTNFTMSFQLEWAYWPLKFKFAAGTSRGVLHQKDSYILRLTHPDYPERIGYGEISVLPGLSPECDSPHWVQTMYTSWLNEKSAWIDPFKAPHVENYTSSFSFALECAWAQWSRHTSMSTFLDTPFFDPIAINGLIWMGDEAWMEKQIEEKLEAGFTTLKMKVGALDLSIEKRLLKKIRSVASAQDLTLRVDANGAFDPSKALDILHDLAAFDIHSIEQPIRPGLWEATAHLCRHSPIPIALDEELIGVQNLDQKKHLLNWIQPAYIILKPSLHGGISSSQSWIQLAEETSSGWWMTSALESNLGLHAICQLTSTYRPTLPQGLGTGSLYHNNIPSPLTVQDGTIQYSINGPSWDLGFLDFHAQPVDPLP